MANPVSSSTCSYQVFDIAGPTTIQAAVEAAGLTYVRGHGFYRKLKQTQSPTQWLKPLLSNLETG